VQFNSNTFKPNYLGRKDKLKANQANKFIGYGAKGSSTERYRINCSMANVGSYTSTDKVFVSVNGKRKDRIKISHLPFMKELLLAVKANVTFITDEEGTSTGQRYSSYNVGEAALADFLLNHDYVDINGDGVWTNEDKYIEDLANYYNP